MPHDLDPHRHPESPLLDHCPLTLPREAYLSPDWYAREQRSIWNRHWVMVGRLADLPPGTLRPLTIAGAPVLVTCSPGGEVAAYHNTCRHRGAELCAHEKPLGKLITCPYHAWSYAASDGRLVSTAYGTPTDDFSKEANGLLPIARVQWNGFLFLNLSPDPGPLTPDIGLNALANWPMADLITGHSHSRILNCNWKVFWENYNECLHCPGIHPELCDMVPIYGTGVMAAPEAQGWTPDQPRTANLKPGAESWTMTGAPCGPTFPGLTPEQRQDGYTFVTLYPTAYIVAHVDYVRAVRLTPLGPEQTALTAEWYFPPETLAQPGFDPAATAAFAKIVLEQDGDAVEMNQRGLRSPAYRHGRLMPQEYAISDFHAWVLREMEAAP